MGSPYQSSVEILPNIRPVRAKANITTKLSLYSKLNKVTMLKLDRGATSLAISRHIRGYEVTCLAMFSLTTLRLDRDIDDMMTSYQPSPRGMAGSAAYPLTQQSARLGTCRVVVCPVTRQLACSGTRRTELYKINPYYLKAPAAEFISVSQLGHRNQQPSAATIHHHWSTTVEGHLSV
ncbi:hypothetical protein Acr_18g0003570 [Actinidia rufa]|uniref:Uncharacterized protein n=1 Tax=Actinidia rufa TaxID=165716 RepID=A0A7J0G5Y8_9ERIC|nr:hypothetical protein Acr_18g0003570 [Actinidia rufa]